VVPYDLVEVVRGPACPVMVLDLNGHLPADWQVVCADEFGPLNLQAGPGRSWHPVRLRATYRRTGEGHMTAALDMAAGQTF
jgi:hypothetical protein